MTGQYVFDRFAASSVSDQVLSFNGFDVYIQELQKCPVDYVNRSTYTYSDPNWAFNDIDEKDYQQPTKKRVLYPGSKLTCSFYPCSRNYVDNRLFWTDDTSGFIKWLAQQVPCKPVHNFYVRCSNNFTQNDVKDMNFFQMTYMSFKCDQYYNFRFAGMHNLDYM